MSKTVLDGACRFCGQIRHVEVEANSSIEKIAEAATMLCSCDEAKDYQMTVNGEAAVNEIFGVDFPECSEILKASIPHIISRKIKEVVVDTGSDVKGRIKKKDGMLVVKREEKHNQESNIG